MPEDVDAERWIVVDGRRWRRSDPAIPEPLRAELVAELMAARRAIGAGDESARARVRDAKVALGERGAPWWEPASEDHVRQRLASAMRALARHRAPEKTICPSDAARAADGQGWRALMDLARQLAGQLARDGQVVVEQRGEPVDPDGPWRGPIRIRAAEPP